MDIRKEDYKPAATSVTSERLVDLHDEKWVIDMKQLGLLGHGREVGFWHLHSRSPFV
jgi:hypothetical protein